MFCTKNAKPYRKLRRFCVFEHFAARYMLVFGGAFVPSTHLVAEVLAHISPFMFAFRAQLENAMYGQVFVMDLSGVAVGTLSGKDWMELLGVPRAFDLNVD